MAGRLPANGAFVHHGTETLVAAGNATVHSETDSATVPATVAARLTLPLREREHP